MQCWKKQIYSLCLTGQPIISGERPDVLKQPRAQPGIICWAASAQESVGSLVQSLGFGLSRSTAPAFPLFMKTKSSPGRPPQRLPDTVDVHGRTEWKNEAHQWYKERMGQKSAVWCSGK